MQNNTRKTRKTIADLDAEVQVLRGEIAEVRSTVQEGFATVLEALAGKGVTAPEVPAITVPTVQGTVVTVTDEAPQGIPFREQRVALKALKAQGLAPAGMTVKEALAAGVMDAFGRPGNGTTPQVVVAQATPAQPARERTAKQHLAAKAVSSAPRRADGTITPKSEWAAREALAETGRFDRFEIDAMVAEYGPELVLEALAN